MTVLDRFSLEGTTAIVTGGGFGIGKATAIALAEAGANLVLAGIDIRNQAKSEPQLKATVVELQKLGIEATYVVADVCNRSDVKATLDHALKTFGKVDILVNNAGGPRGKPGQVWETPFVDLSDEVWDVAIRNNIMSTALCGSIVGAHMIERKSGAIVNFSSGDGLGPTPGAAHYAASKAAVVNLTETMAVELGPSGIRVNAIAPGRIYHTPPSPQEESLYISWCPLRRLGVDNDIASVVVFLAGDAAGWITGQTIDVSGGTGPRHHMSSDPRWQSGAVVNG